MEGFQDFLIQPLYFFKDGEKTDMERGGDWLRPPETRPLSPAPAHCSELTPQCSSMYVKPLCQLSEDTRMLPLTFKLGIRHKTLFISKGISDISHPVGEVLASKITHYESCVIIAKSIWSTSGERGGQAGVARTAKCPFPYITRPTHHLRLLGQPYS